MKKSKKTYPPGASFTEFFDEQMKNPKFRREYEALEPEFAIIKQIIELRIKRQMTQAQLAKKIGTRQPSIARLEARGKTTDLNYLQRVAQALNARVEVRLVPLEASAPKAVHASAPAKRATRTLRS
jgi:DNA-binding XRE family transcriptional regulator